MFLNGLSQRNPVKTNCLTVQLTIRSGLGLVFGFCKILFCLRGFFTQFRTVGPKPFAAAAADFAIAFPQQAVSYQISTLCGFFLYQRRVKVCSRRQLKSYQFHI